MQISEQTDVTGDRRCLWPRSPVALPVADDVIVVLADPPTMSIYSTLWRLQFPLDGDAYTGCEWVEVCAQGVPAHVGTPTPGYGYESGDRYEAFLPPALRLEDGAPEHNLRAVVFIIADTKKGTARAGQEYESPLLVLSGAEYAAMPFQDLHDRLCDALRGSKPRLVLQLFAPGATPILMFEDGSTVPRSDSKPE